MHPSSQLDQVRYSKEQPAASRNEGLKFSITFSHFCSVPRTAKPPMKVHRRPSGTEVILIGIRTQ